ncbi:Gonadotropin-releasing hormone II receptor [Orchesella cincta]|uniref:Gonadotropin-releasing hormone II receptor n=1 Tax=Orchesella cincta TaxID=48709 RepID=A0A1D2MK05_ORCCI|nr:Gonadotropin-releasing hormone II receptor [Orchesella cincta]
MSLKEETLPQFYVSFSVETLSLLPHKRGFTIENSREYFKLPQMTPNSSIFFNNISSKGMLDLEISMSENYTEIFFEFWNNLSIFENSSERRLPIDMRFNNGHLLSVILYPILMTLSAIGNIAVFSVILRLRLKGKLNRIHLLVLHLTIADLLVTFLMMPLEIGWNYTVSWDAGDGLCRIMSFFRIFGLYLSSFLLMCISIDRYYAVIKPLAIYEANRRAKWMLAFAWIGSIIFSLPQALIFHVEVHPEFRWYQQCITFNSFPSRNVELAYNLISFFFLYVLPMLTIIFCYARILAELYRVNSQKQNDDMLRRSNLGVLGRAKVRMLKMTVIIVATFVFCWTPYNVMSLW